MDHKDSSKDGSKNKFDDSKQIKNISEDLNLFRESKDESNERMDPFKIITNDVINEIEQNNFKSEGTSRDFNSTEAISNWPTKLNESSNDLSNKQILNESYYSNMNKNFIVSLADYSNKESKIYLEQFKNDSMSGSQIISENFTNDSNNNSNKHYFDCYENQLDINEVNEENDIKIPGIDVIDGRKRKTTNRFNTFAAKKIVAQGMLDIALFTANSNQLRYLIEFRSSNSKFLINIILISFSILLQIFVGIALIFKGRLDVTGKSKNSQANKLNNFIIICVFLITCINIFIASFAIDSN